MLNLLRLLTFSWTHKIITSSNTNFKVNKFELCNNTQGFIKFDGNITKEQDTYYINGIIILPIPLDENIGFTCKIESLVLDQYIELFTIREKNLCKAANIYLSEFWYDIERAAQIIPKTCPIPARRYEAHHAKLDFSKIGLQTFPFGYLRFTARAVDNKQPRNNLLCIVMEVENVPN